MPSVHEASSNGKPQLSPIAAAAVSLIARGIRVVSLHGIIQPGTYGKGPDYRLAVEPRAGANSITIDKPQCACVAGAKCKHPGKHPRFKSWQNGCTSLDEINEKWMNCDNLGVLTGMASRLFGLDIDPRNGGEDSLHALVMKHGPMPNTLQATTGGGGRLFLFKEPGMLVPNTTGIYPGIDLRGDGALVVVPPSNHLSGKRYEWDGMLGFDAPILPAPAWLLRWLMNDAAASISSHDRLRTPPIGEVSRDGKKHHDIMSAIGKMIEQGYNRKQMFAVLRATDFESPVSDKELLERVDDGIERWKPGKALEGQSVLDRSGNPKPEVNSALSSLQGSAEWRGVMGLSYFSGQIATLKPAPFRGSKPGPWTDCEDILTAAWLQRNGVHVNKQIASQAIQAFAMEHKFHPVRDYLDSLKHDGKPRIKAWTNQYLGAEHNAYTSAVGERWLISAIARIYEPGCKVDCMLILEGDQGTKKSTALRILGAPWFIDHMREMGSKDAAIQCQGVWIIEMAELEFTSRGEWGTIKAFVSRATDDFRPVWEKHRRPFPRQCVFAGSGNKETYLPDETGNRRFWPILCGETIRIEDLERDRDQLWAEARDFYRAKHTWWLDTPELRRMAEAQQADRYEEDPWHEGIARWLEHRTENVSLEDVIRECTNKPRDQWTQDVKNRVARTLRALGWKRYRVKINGQLFWRYRRSVSL